ncbi:hypothetical protein ACRBEV_04525 [Methylobacterium phyllosphaerae]
MRHSDTVGDALRALEMHACTQNWGAVVDLAIGNDIAVLSYCPYRPDTEGAPLYSERALALSVNLDRASCEATAW